MRVSGLRSSCDASATKRVWRVIAASRRSNVSFIVRARRSTSSPVPGSATRRPWWPAVMSASSRRIRSTGRKVRPVSHHVSAAREATTSGTAPASTRDRIRTGSDTSSSLTPTSSVAGPRGVSTVRATTRNRSGRPGTSSTVRTPSLRRRDRRHPLDARRGLTHRAVGGEHLDQHVLVARQLGRGVDGEQRGDLVGAADEALVEVVGELGPEQPHGDGRHDDEQGRRHDRRRHGRAEADGPPHAGQPPSLSSR